MNPPLPQQNSNLLSVSRSDIISLVSQILDYRERAKIPARLGKLITLADPEETYFHVEPSREDGPEWIVLWRIADWRTHYENWKRQKEQDGLERAVNVHFSDIRDRVLRKLRASSIFSMLDPQAQEALAFKLVIERETTALAVFAPGIRLDDLLKADRALQEFKSSTNATR